jgi:uncharacterized protein YgiB involved in biofilm formation
MRAFRLSLIAAVTLAGCTTAQLTTATSDISAGIQAACSDAMAAVPVAQQAAATNPTATAKVANIAAYAQGGCATATAVAALAQNSATLEWLGNLTGQLTAVAPAAPAS